MGLSVKIWNINTASCNEHTPLCYCIRFCIRWIALLPMGWQILCEIIILVWIVTLNIVQQCILWCEETTYLRNIYPYNFSRLTNFPSIDSVYSWLVRGTALYLLESMIMTIGWPILLESSNPSCIILLLMTLKIWLMTPTMTPLLMQ